MTNSVTSVQVKPIAFYQLDKPRNEGGLAFAITAIFCSTDCLKAYLDEFPNERTRLDQGFREADESYGHVDDACCDHCGCGLD